MGASVWARWTAHGMSIGVWTYGGIDSHNSPKMTDLQLLFLLLLTGSESEEVGRTGPKVSSSAEWSTFTGAATGAASAFFSWLFWFLFA